MTVVPSYHNLWKPEAFLDLDQTGCLVYTFVTHQRKGDDAFHPRHPQLSRSCEPHGQSSTSVLFTNSESLRVPNYSDGIAVTQKSDNSCKEQTNKQKKIQTTNKKPCGNAQAWFEQTFESYMLFKPLEK